MCWLGHGPKQGIIADIFARMDDRLTDMGAQTPVTLIGWSLGGVIAREYAKYAPHRIKKVITLGSPFSSCPRANNGWRVYEFIAGHKVDAPPLDVTLSGKPQCRRFPSGHRGTVWLPARGLRVIRESDVRIEAYCTHMGMVADPNVIRRIAESILD